MHVTPPFPPGKLRRSAAAAAVTTLLLWASAGQADAVRQAPSGGDAPPAAGVAADVVNAYVYGYPLVLTQATRQLSTNVARPNAATLQAPVNRFATADNVPSPEFRTVVSPNVDTLYSSAWLDLKAGPVVLHVPDTRGRYYLMPILSAWTDVIASPGKRTTGTKAGDFAVTGPEWHGTLPAGVKRIKSPTDSAWIIGRTQLNGPADLPAVRALAAQYTLTPLSRYGRAYTPPAGRVDPSVPTTPPADRVARMDATAFFSRLASAMATNPAVPADAPMAATLKRLGISPGKPFDINAKGTATARALREAVTAGQQKIQKAVSGLGEDVNGWRVATDLGRYGTDYLRRAATAWQGLGANLPQDAVYPTVFTDSKGRQLTGERRYTLHFPPGRTPPANAFWSLTMYDQQGFLVPNALNRYEIGHTVKPRPNSDNSVDIYIQHDPPAAGKQANWLPAPTGPFNVMLRMYWPRQSVLAGTWTPPPVITASGPAAPDELARTGDDGVGFLAAGAALCLATGGALIVLARRHGTASRS
ncbi:DUF1254 domain-containing protein [Streptomyces purpurogeneiscleroticus]|uniref:DUF1254 domain-containing protein n=1 Tax=Streptomyces purpurogeneiscleroticus TaxID=68259 RepID=UPI001CBF371D|nr:DUF1254 domain-containing protein [Streptomyces purpurogeneiscleroticus]MBZ4014342.1 hypothetical protein [Streptomyces purpurogeneiscleroticus]